MSNPTTTAPLCQAGVPTYEAYPRALLGLNSLPTLQQRVGNRFWDGIYVINTRTGSTTVTSSGTAIGTIGNGVYVSNDGFAIDLTVSQTAGTILARIMAFPQPIVAVLNAGDPFGRSLESRTFILARSLEGYVDQLDDVGYHVPCSDRERCLMTPALYHDDPSIYR
ncbi:hypothetical protein GGD52_003890 [Agrobacterium tumefaciens]|nr:hypothetical protein [Agrobacterium radiobacter]MBB5589269.1 hypothetical protein [Agrobacterium radiobacter]